MLIVWVLGFILAEAGGVAVSSQFTSLGFQTLGVSIGQLATIVVRILVLVYFAPVAGLTLSATYRKPLPSRLPLVLSIAVAMAILAYLVNLATSPVGRPTTVIQYSSFVIGGALWTIPFSLTYYLSEIILLNYLYMLAKRTWSAAWSPTLAAIIFLILGWASLHAITQNPVTAAYAIALVPIFYLSYEYSGRSPITPILLWFVTLVF